MEQYRSKCYLCDGTTSPGGDIVCHSYSTARADLARPVPGGSCFQEGTGFLFDGYLIAGFNAAPSSKGLLYNLNAPTRTRTLIPALTYQLIIKVAPGANLSLAAVLQRHSVRVRVMVRVVVRV